MLMSAHDGGVEHHVFVGGIAGQQLENALENALFAHRLKRWCTIFQSPNRAGIDTGYDGLTHLQYFQPFSFV